MPAGMTSDFMRTPGWGASSRAVITTPTRDYGDSYAVEFDLALGNDPREGGSFWIDEDTGKIEYPSNAYVEAYVEGVMSVWDEVEDKL